MNRTDRLHALPEELHRAVEAALARRRVLALTWCLERAAARWFRCDRIEGAALTPDAAAERDPAPFGSPPPEADPVRRRPSTAHPAGRARRPGPAAHGPSARAAERLAPVVPLRSVR